MRDPLLLGFIIGCLLIAIRYPFAGLMVWGWFTLMTPHQAAYGVYGLPLNAIIAGVTIAAYILSGEVKKFRLEPVSATIILFALWLMLSQIFSLNSGHSAVYLDRFLKTLLFALLVAQMARDRLRFNAMVWIFVASIGFFAAKGALFTIFTLGEFRVQGLPNTVLEDNNHFGIAAATTLPMILYLRAVSKSAIVRNGLMALFALTVIGIIGTHSRGALICLMVFGGAYWIRAKHKFSIAAVFVALMAPSIAFMPVKWTERMTTITHAAQDESFMGRVDAWVINLKLARDHPLTGAGLRNSYDPEIAATVDPSRAQTAKAAHSIYFEVLGGAGVVGLLIYLAIFGAAYFALRKAVAPRRWGAPPQWRSEYAHHAQLALIVFAIGGASTSMEMWDGYLVLIALSGALAAGQSRAHAQSLRAVNALKLDAWRRRRRQAREKAEIPNEPRYSPGRA